jgi:hypothetical protein
VKILFQCDGKARIRIGAECWIRTRSRIRNAVFYILYLLFSQAEQMVRTRRHLRVEAGLSSTIPVVQEKLKKKNNAWRRTESLSIDARSKLHVKMDQCRSCMICSLESLGESASRSYLPGGSGQLLELEQLHDLLLGELG